MDLHESSIAKVIDAEQPGTVNDRGGTARDNRLFVEAVLWIARTGSPWRDLPESFGHLHRVYPSVYVRYNRWSKKGVWSRPFEMLSEDQDLESLMVDGSIVRVHQQGAPKNRARRNGGWKVTRWIKYKNTRRG